MDDVVSDMTVHATQERLTRASQTFSANLEAERLLASPRDQKPTGLAIANRVIHEGSNGDTMHKLIHVQSGYLDVEGCSGGWLVLSGNLIFIPAHRAFNINGTHETKLNIIHLDPVATPWHHHGCWVTRAPALAREMIQYAVILSYFRRNKKVPLKNTQEKLDAYILALSLICSDWFENARMLFIPAAQSHAMAKLMIYLRDHIATASVEDAARIIGFSQRSLHRYCIQEFGYNLRTLIREIKIVLAMELLSTTDHTIGSIGQTVGFASLSAFTSAFSKRLNMTPRQFLSEINMRGGDQLRI